MTHDELDGSLLEALNRGYCPDCQHRGFVLGPRGGLAQNIECGGVACRARFNVSLSPLGPPGAIVLAQRIERESEGGARWVSKPETRQ